MAKGNECLLWEVLPLLISWSGDTFLGRRSRKAVPCYRIGDAAVVPLYRFEGVEWQKMEGSMSVFNPQSDLPSLCRIRSAWSSRGSEKANIMFKFHIQKRQEWQYNAFETNDGLASAKGQLR
jgi:hypothetical protein